MKNVDNYRDWITQHHLRWAGDWPAPTDMYAGDANRPAEVYYPDPITDATWADHWLGNVDAVGAGPNAFGAWELVKALRNEWYQEDWRPFDDEVY